MAGNSQRRGAMRKPGTKKGATTGTGGQKSKGLKGKGPTPKATERTGHPAARRQAARATRASTGSSGSRGRSTGSPGRGSGSEQVVGRNSVVEALRADVPATALYVASRIDGDERVREALALANERELPLLEAPRSELDSMTRGAVHQGLVLKVPAYEYADVDDLVATARDADEALLLVALDGVTDPRNLGAVVRSAAAFGAHGVVIAERRAAPMTASAWKASAGAASRVRVARVTNLTRSLRGLHADGVAVVGLAADGDFGVDDPPYADGPLVLVVGAEGPGMSRLVREACDAVVSIDMASGQESLNASVAAGIALHAVHAARAARPD
jgi:23S rRNA (guanosine2251-2'-O)-methyltransferase